MSNTLRKQPVQRRSQATFDAIVEATIQVLLRDGAGQMTTTRVAERAGVSVGTLYQYYPNKEALLAEVKSRYFTLMLEAVGGVLKASDGTEKTMILAAGIDALIDVKRRNRDLSMAMSHLSDAASSHLGRSDIVETFTTLLCPLFEEGGAISPRQARNKALLLVTGIEGMLQHALRFEPDWLVETWFVDELKRFAAGLIESDGQQRR